jgi:hypothetical protein
MLVCDGVGVSPDGVSEVIVSEPTVSETVGDKLRACCVTLADVEALSDCDCDDERAIID